MLAGHTAVSAGLSPPHACKQRSWELQLVLSAERGTQLAFDPDKLRVFFWDDKPIADEQLKYLDWARRFMTIPPIIA